MQCECRGLEALCNECGGKGLVVPKHHNGACPCCKDTWKFDQRTATLTNEQKADLKEYGHILVICKDCQNEGAYAGKLAEDLQQEYINEWQRPVEYD